MTRALRTLRRWPDTTPPPRHGKSIIINTTRFVNIDINQPVELPEHQTTAQAATQVPDRHRGALHDRLPHPTPQVQLLPRSQADARHPRPQRQCAHALQATGHRRHERDVHAALAGAAIRRQPHHAVRRLHGVGSRGRGRGTAEPVPADGRRADREAVPRAQVSAALRCDR